MFYHWLKRLDESNSVTIEIGNYYDRVRKYISDFVRDHNEEVEAAQEKSLDYTLLFNLLTKLGFKQAKELVEALKTKKKAQAVELLKAFFQFRSQINIDDHKLRWEVYKLLSLAEKQFDAGQDSFISPQREKEWYDDVIEKSGKNIDEMYKFIQEAVSKVGNWNGSSVTMKPRMGENITDPVDSASVTVGTTSADFTLFYNSETNKSYIDDILDYGDTDFFQDDETQQDYFQLVQEIKKPGSTTRGGKFITLYTARPTDDRKIYLDSSESESPWIPAGIFLANNIDHVSGLAVDLSSGGSRDIWRVKIDSNKVILTNDTPEVKYYQAVGSGKVSVKSLTLIEEG